MNGMNFNRPYERKVFRDFLQHTFLPEDFTPADQEMDLEFKTDKIKSVSHLGQCPDLGLNVYEIRHGSEHDPRVSLTKETFRLMKAYRDFNALAVFVSSNSKNYRFSYITVGLKPEGTKAVYEQSNPRRYSYFLGPDAKINTPTRFLVNRGRVADMDDLGDRFSVEVVNKEFYREIAGLFTELVGGKRGEGSKAREFDGILRLPSVTDHQKKQEFAVRMIGRIVFCWFLKKKTTSGGLPLIPESILSLEAVKGNKNYYHTILEKLFFQVLNTPQKQRRKEFESGHFAGIPFLNGGLFEPHDDDIYELNEFSGTSNFDNTLVVPDEWLEKLLELLERYNFTIDENTSMDVELSVDPEMLGRIFENLLAEINPETGETARKSTGSYYTPRPIVEYMVDESLKQYLLTKTGIEEGKLQRLLSFSEDVEELSGEERRKIIDALDTVKIIDPACGSGAFPMGILQKMVLVLQKADEDLEIWKNKQLQGISSSYVRSAVEERMKSENWNYIRKMGIIQDAVYGVDIQQIAVEISKLRVFLSLVVDTEVIVDKPNKGIEPLPNLEFKFVCANTLVGLSGNSSSVFDAPKEYPKLKSLKEQYFSSVGSEKHRIEREYREIQTKMFEHSLSMKSFGDKTQALSEWDPFSDEASKWFDPDWMFDIKNGFDIVIANPPYVRNEAIRDFKPQLKKDFQDFYCGTADLYTYFYKSGLNILKQGGHLCFIAPNKFMRAVYGKKTRFLLSREATPRIIIDFGDLPIFDATTYPAIILLENRVRKGNTKAIAATFTKDSQLNNISGNLLSIGFPIAITSLKPDGWILASENVLALIDKLRKNGILLGKYIHDKLFYGIKTGFNDAFVINRETREKLISEDPRSAELIKPWLRGRDIRKWRAEWADFYIISISSSVNREWPWSNENKEENARKIFSKSYPVVHRHLSKWETKLRKRKDQGKFWWELRSCAYYEEFEKPKIVYPNICKKPEFTYDENSFYTNQKCFIIPTTDKYLLGVLNSYVTFFLFKMILPRLRGNFFEPGYKYLKNFPIPLFDLENPIEKKRHNQIVAKVDAILEFTHSDDYFFNTEKMDKVKTYEKEIDQLVYQLYDLTPEEIAIVEGKNERY